MEDQIWQIKWDRNDIRWGRECQEGCRGIVAWVVKINQHLEFVDETEKYSMWTRDSMGKSTENGEKSFYQKWEIL